ncbi:MAG: RQC domain-containing protein [Candidatus Eremiobacterota bacterium]
MSIPEHIERQILQAVADQATSVGVCKLTSLLAGSSSQDLANHLGNPCFGVQSQRSREEIRTDIQELIRRGLLLRLAGFRPVVVISRAGVRRLESMEPDPTPRPRDLAERLLAQLERQEREPTARAAYRLARMAVARLGPKRDP